jgi:cytochrome c oxidase cbb3-type subunit 4
VTITHDFLLWLSKSFGLFYLIGLSLIVLAYTYWPANQKSFEHAAQAVLDDDDKPYRG